MRRLASAHLAGLVAIAFTVAAPALAQEPVRVDPDAAVAAFTQHEIATAPTIEGVAVAGPVSILPKSPEDIPPSLHEQIRGRQWRAVLETDPSGRLSRRNRRDGSG